MNRTTITLFQELPQLYRAAHLWQPGSRFFDIHCYEEARPRLQGVKLGRFRCNFYQVSLVYEGTTGVTAGYQTFDILPASLIVTGPNHLQVWNKSEGVIPMKGYILFFSEDFLSLSPQNSALLADFPFFSAGAEIVIPLKPEPAAVCKELYRTILYEYHSGEKDRFLVIRNLLHVLLLYAKRSYPPTAAVATASAQSVSHHLTRRLLALIDQTVIKQVHGQPAPLRTVADYADALCVHPYHLNRVVRKVLGKNASAVLADRVLGEAKSLLSQAGLTVSEVSYLLGFSDSSYFTKFFKKHTRLSPSAFKEKYKV